MDEDENFHLLWDRERTENPFREREAALAKAIGLRSEQKIYTLLRNLEREYGLQGTRYATPFEDFLGFDIISFCAFDPFSAPLRLQVKSSGKCAQEFRQRQRKGQRDPGIHVVVVDRKSDATTKDRLVQVLRNYCR